VFLSTIIYIANRVALQFVEAGDARSYADQRDFVSMSFYNFLSSFGLAAAAAVDNDNNDELRRWRKGGGRRKDDRRLGEYHRVLARFCHVRSLTIVPTDN